MDATHRKDAYDAILAFDTPALDRWIASAGHGTPETRAWLRWARLWSLLFHGEHGAAGDEAEALESDAASSADATLVVEAAALRALAASSAGDLPRATSIARRASRMARTEAIPEQEWLAHLVLSRVRRLTGHPHLATRILGALANVAPSTWHAWLRWELVMAGAFETAFPDGTGVALATPQTPAAAAARALGEVCAAAENGDAAAFARASGHLERAVTWPMLAEEARALLDACDVSRPPADAGVVAWCAGATGASPAHLHGLLTRVGSAPADESAIAYVIAHPEGIRRRIPRLAWAFAQAPDDGAVAVLPQGRRKQGRVETLVSALALAGDRGMEEAECFADVYEFAYEPEVHKNIFHVLVHRARDYLGDAGTVEVSSGRVHLALARPVLVPDPRCTKPMQDRLLRAVAEQRGATAKDIAHAVGISLRLAQSALQELSADGACLAQRDGRVVRYVVEDTTFSEPTRV